MKRIYLLGPAFISNIIIFFSVLILPCRGSDMYTIYFGYPFPFLSVYKETTITIKDLLINNIAINILTYMIDLVICMLVINLIINI